MFSKNKQGLLHPFAKETQVRGPHPAAQPAAAGLAAGHHRADAGGVRAGDAAVSYTHLDVYKRQVLP